LREIKPLPGPFSAAVVPPPDKSITHRALLLASEASGESLIGNASLCADCISTVDCLRRLGVNVRQVREGIIVSGKGLGSLSRPEGPLYAGNSGTTARLISGILARQQFASSIAGDGSLSRRPMERVAEALGRMGASVETTGGHLPMTIMGSRLTGIEHTMEAPSAQLKSAILFAALGAEGSTAVTEPVPTRDHTERLFRYAGIPVFASGGRITTQGAARFAPFSLDVPGDISSASFLAAAAAIIPGSSVTIRDVGLNPSRMGFFRLLEMMGAGVVVDQRESAWEPRGDMTVVAGRLQPVSVSSGEVPGMVDEIPLVAVLASFAEGVSSVCGAGQLREKESDRIKAVTENLGRMGVRIRESEQGFTIEGRGGPLNGAEIRTRGDHRIAMAFSVAGLAARGNTLIDDHECVSVSYPGFFDELVRIARG